MRKFIFLWFMAVGLISVIGAVWIGRSMKLAAADFYESDVASQSTETIAHALDTGGVSALRTLERRLDPKGKIRFFVFDGVNQVSGDTAPESVRTLAGALRSQENTHVELTDGGFLSGSIVTTHDGRVYRVIVRFPTSRKIASLPIQAWDWSGRMASVVAAAGLLCLWLAWRLSAPLTRLSHAASQFASGDLKARAGADTFPSSPPEYKKLAQDFDDMAERIEMLVDSQRQFLRDVSHELRTPLTRLSIAVDNARHAPAPVVAPSLDRIDHESERLNALIDRIIRLSRLEAFAEPPRHDVIECADFIETMVSDADFEAAGRKRRVSVLRAETCRLAGDRELLREAIENMLRNAIRYTPQGTAVTVDAYRDGPSAYQIVIRDCGPGVPVEHLEAIFEPFHRAPQRMDTDASGFGIGLAIAKRAISVHHGTITARNPVEGGFEIAVRLPVCVTPAPARTE